MRENENQIIKVCSLYVNEWHLTTMILPHIKRTIEENTKVITILENGIKSKIEELLSRISLNNEMQNKILSINWSTNPACKYSQIEKQIENIEGDIERIEIIVNGKEEYIKNANINIEKIIKKLTGKKITIINCYEFKENSKTDQILDNHDFILNTSGIKTMEEVFKNYNKKEIKNENKNII